MRRSDGPAATHRLRRSALIGLVVGSIAPLSALLAQSSGAAAPAPARAAVTRAADVTVSPPAQRAWNWVLAQQASATTVTSASTITAAQTYAADWTGAVSGTFQPSGVSSPVLDPASLTVDTPAQVPGTYTGVLQGHVLVAPSSGRWIVQAYRDTASGRTQVPLQALADAAGNFSLDLGTAPAQPAGSWALGLLDAQHSYAAYGGTWPAVRTYRDWAVRAYVVTDTAYLVGEQPARADNTFAFADSRPGTKVFQLVDTVTGAVLAEQSPSFGLVRSYAGDTRTYTYDQALAVITALAVGADPTSLTSGLLALQRPDGAFVDSADARNPAAGGGDIRTGVTAVATYALLRRVATMPTTDPARAAVTAAAQRGVDWLIGLQRTDGLIAAGFDSGSSTPTPWIATEHEVDAWQALHLATTVLDDQRAGAAATALASATVSKLWDASAQRFRRGLDPAGAPDTTDALDTASWGALFLRPAGYPQLAAQALAHTASFASSVGANSGYRSYYPQPNFSSAPANVWIEGSAGVALAQLRGGASAAASTTLAQLAQLQRADGSFPYAAVADQDTDMTTGSSVAAATWFVLASTAPDGVSIWD